MITVSVDSADDASPVNEETTAPGQPPLPPPVCRPAPPATRPQFMTHGQINMAILDAYLGHLLQVTTDQEVEHGRTSFVWKGFTAAKRLTWAGPFPKVDPFLFPSGGAVDFARMDMYRGGANQDRENVDHAKMFRDLESIRRWKGARAQQYFQDSWTKPKQRDNMQGNVMEGIIGATFHIATENRFLPELHGEVDLQPPVFKKIAKKTWFVFQNLGFGPAQPVPDDIQRELDDMAQTVEGARHGADGHEVGPARLWQLVRPRPECSSTRATQAQKREAEDGPSPPAGEQQSAKAARRGSSAAAAAAGQGGGSSAAAWSQEDAAAEAWSQEGGSSPAASGLGRGSSAAAWNQEGGSSPAASGLGRGSSAAAWNQEGGSSPAASGPGRGSSAVAAASGQGGDYSATAWSQEDRGQDYPACRTTVLLPVPPPQLRRRAKACVSHKWDAR